MTLFSRRSGCALAVIVPVMGVLYLLFGVSLNRTVALAAEPIAAGDIDLHLEAADFEESLAPWPIFSTVTYLDNGRIRGKIRQRSSAERTADFKIVIVSREGASRVTRCYPDYRDACYFDADLGHTSLAKGIRLSVFDARNGQVVVAPRTVAFSRSTTYSSARWDALMGI
ncbi:hypothetical protein [Sphingomonas sp.]|uniref:hypothetical protein n=1 Tax=Sphingomonas sp. TaxID=28214 RepID=UPI0025FDB6EC|nr:hypothetical protein [Sphingomonas sp.]